MQLLEILVFVALGYAALLLCLELIVWKIQPNMEGVVTLHINTGETVVSRKLYGLEFNNSLYVASNHWFRSWFHAALAHPDIKVERGEITARYSVTPVEGDEHQQVADEYDMGLPLRIACGFAPQRFLRLDRLPD